MSCIGGSADLIWFAKLSPLTWLNEWSQILTRDKRDKKSNFWYAIDCIHYPIALSAFCHGSLALIPLTYIPPNNLTRAVTCSSISRKNIYSFGLCSLSGKSGDVQSDNGALMLQYLWLNSRIIQRFAKTVHENGMKIKFFIFLGNLPLEPPYWQRTCYSSCHKYSV